MGHGRLSPSQPQVRTLRPPLALLYWAIGGLLVACLVLSATGRLDSRAQLGTMPGAPQLLAVALATHTPTQTPTPTATPAELIPTHARSVVPTFTPTAAPPPLPTVTPIPLVTGALRLPTPTPAASH